MAAPVVDTRAAAPRLLRDARLPAWALPADWPREGGRPVAADVEIDAGRIGRVMPVPPPSSRAAVDAAGAAPDAATWHLAGAPVLPGLVDVHTHLDKTFTLSRIGAVRPGLLGAIEAMHLDRDHWTADDVRARAGRALGWAWAAGVTRLRTHCDWWEPDAVPVAWPALQALADEWAGRVAIDRVALLPLPLFGEADAARRLARRVAAGGEGARLGGFIHTSNWNPQALRHLLESADAAGLDVDLHIDEELAPAAAGLATLAGLLADLRFANRVVCSHACALAAQPEAEALATLDALARLPVSLVSLPITNLLLQDATTGRTPRLRGLTLVKEARERGIPVLIASDNVQDPFCHVGSYDPVEALAAGVLAGQLEQPFDRWSESICRADWLSHGASTTRLAPGLQTGSPADLVVFTAADVHGWPSRAQVRTVLRDGRVIVPTGDAFA